MVQLLRTLLKPRISVFLSANVTESVRESGEKGLGDALIHKYILIKPLGQDLKSYPITELEIRTTRRLLARADRCIEHKQV